MTVLYVLMPLAILVVGGFVVAFVWTVKSGQLDDTDTPAQRILVETTAVRASAPAQSEDSAREPTATGERNEEKQPPGTLPELASVTKAG